MNQDVPEYPAALLRGNLPVVDIGDQTGNPEKTILLTICC